jgi:hypothetical protein
MCFPSPAHRELGCDEPFVWVHWANDWQSEPDLVNDPVDQACRPFEEFIAAELCFHQNCVKKRPAIRQYCPRDVAAHIRCERVPDDVDLLQIQRFCNFSHAFVVVALVAK